MTTYCKVRGCRFNRTHITMFHKCGTCGQFGHGNWECNYDNDKVQLETHYKTTELIPITDRCQIYNCKLPWTHTSEAHYCSKCEERGIEHLEDCTTNSFIINLNNNINNNTKTVKCPSCNSENCTVDMSKEYSVDGNCVICYNKGKMVLIEPCNHVTVCVECVKSL